MPERWLDKWCLKEGQHRESIVVAMHHKEFARKFDLKLKEGKLYKVKFFAAVLEER